MVLEQESTHHHSKINAALNIIERSCGTHRRNASGLDMVCESSKDSPKSSSCSVPPCTQRCGPQTCHMWPDVSCVFRRSNSGSDHMQRCPQVESSRKKCHGSSLAHACMHACIHASRGRGLSHQIIRFYTTKQSSSLQGLKKKSFHSKKNEKEPPKLII